MKLGLIAGAILFALLITSISSDAKPYAMGLNVTPAEMNATAKT
jgi:hypothetical protein